MLWLNADEEYICDGLLPFCDAWVFSVIPTWPLACIFAFIEYR